MVDWRNATFGCSSHGASIQINFSILNIRVDISSDKNGGYKYRRSALKFHDNKFCITHGNSFNYFEGFERFNLTLKKT
jgi:hypothetical protein